MSNVTNVALPAPERKAKRLKATVVLYRGSQWRATTRHVETIDGRRYGQNYWFDVKRLAENLGPWGWPCQLADKEWCNLSDFIAAFRAACRHFGVNAELVEASITRARANRARRASRPTIH
jgi:hypothetical protein